MCDEVTSALDTVVGASIIELLKRLRQETGVSTVFISHDLSTIASFADSILVLYAGRVVEYGSVNEVLSPPFHPYTRLLISSVPEVGRGWLERTIAERTAAAVDAEDAAAVPADIGCTFFSRCEHAMHGLCDTTLPPTRQIDGTRAHRIVCHLDTLTPTPEPVEASDAI